MKKETNINKQTYQSSQKDKGPRVNLDIEARKVRVIDENGEMKGVLGLVEALELAENAGLDLVEVSPHAEPPVCKILDYGKYKYEQQKKAAEARKKQRTADVKEVKIRPTTEKHDYDVKMRNARRFLENGDKVKVSMRFRGREIANREQAMEMMKKMAEELSDVGKVDLEPKMEGRQMMMVLSATN